ncbi:MAG: hypothetical protein ABR964_11410 [Tepidisphaeraceae bacterium]
MLHQRPAKTQGEFMLRLVGGSQTLEDALRDDRRRLAELMRIPQNQIQFDTASELPSEDPERWDGLS